MASIELGPAGREVRRSILRKVQRGALMPGDKLDAERELATQLGVSRSTLRQALIALEAEGVVRRVPGRGGGTFIASAKVDRDLSHIMGVPRLLRDQGFTAGSRVLSVSVALADADAAEALGIEVGSGVVDLVRIRLADGAPISLERAVLPSELVPGLPERELSGSVYELLDREYGLRPAEATEHIEVVAATPDEARILEIDAGAPLLLITRTTSDGVGRLFEYSQDLFRADRMRISVKMQGSAKDEVARLPRRVVEPLGTEASGTSRRRSFSPRGRHIIGA